MILDRITLDVIGDVIVSVNAVVLVLKYALNLSGRRFAIPVWAFVYLIFSVAFFFYSLAFSDIYFGGAGSNPGAGMANAIIVFTILTSPEQWTQYVKGRDRLKVSWKSNAPGEGDLRRD
jgi:hypothetical protein